MVFWTNLGGFLKNWFFLALYPHGSEFGVGLGLKLCSCLIFANLYLFYSHLEPKASFL